VKYLTYAQAAADPDGTGAGRPVTEDTIRRWVRGIRGENLGHIKIGGSPRLTRELLDDFFRRLSQHD